MTVTSTDDRVAKADAAIAMFEQLYSEALRIQTRAKRLGQPKLQETAAHLMRQAVECIDAWHAVRNHYLGVDRSHDTDDLDRYRDDAVPAADDKEGLF